MQSLFVPQGTNAGTTDDLVRYCLMSGLVDLVIHRRQPTACIEGQSLSCLGLRLYDTEAGISEFDSTPKRSMTASIHASCDGVIVTFSVLRSTAQRRYPDNVLVWLKRIQHSLAERIIRIRLFANNFVVHVHVRHQHRRPVAVSRETHGSALLSSIPASSTGCLDSHVFCRRLFCFNPYIARLSWSIVPLFSPQPSGSGSPRYRSYRCLHECCSSRFTSRWAAAYRAFCNGYD